MVEDGNNILDFRTESERIKLEKTKKVLELEKAKMELERIETEMQNVNMTFATTGSQDALNKLQALLGEKMQMGAKIFDLEESLGIVHNNEDDLLTFKH